MPAFSWLALFFGAFYFVYGAYLPFWSLWLEGIGVSAEMIGLLLGAGMAIRFAGNLMVMGQIKGRGTCCRSPACSACSVCWPSSAFTSATTSGGWWD